MSRRPSPPCVSLCLFVSVYVSAFVVCVSLCLFVSVCVCLCLSAYLRLSPCLCLFVSLGVCLSLSTYLRLSPCPACLSLSVCVCLCLSVSVYVSASVFVSAKTLHPCVSVCVSLCLSTYLRLSSSPQMSLCVWLCLSTICVCLRVREDRPPLRVCLCLFVSVCLRLRTRAFSRAGPKFQGVWGGGTRPQAIKSHLALKPAPFHKPRNAFQVTYRQTEPNVQQEGHPHWPEYMALSKLSVQSKMQKQPVCLRALFHF